jgi:hypothetical protein
MNHKKVLLALCVIVLISGSLQASGLTFNITYTAAVQADPNFASIQNAIDYVSNEYSALYSNPITLNYLVDEGSGSLGESVFSNAYWRGSYADLRAALVADATSADDATATGVANLPLAAPYAPAEGFDQTDDWYATSSEAKALGLLAGDNAALDGTFTFSDVDSYTYDPNDRAVAGEYDFIGVAEHEFAELMGRTQGQNTYDILDSMRFTSPGVRNVSLSGESGVYFSFDNGNTDLAGYNSGAGDQQDFNGAVATDPYNASTGTDQAHALNAVDISEMDVIGYTLASTDASSAPEPSTFLLALPLLGFGLLRLKRVRT